MILIIYFDKFKIQKERNDTVESYPLNSILPYDTLLIDMNDMNNYSIEIYKQPNIGGKCKTKRKKN